MQTGGFGETPAIFLPPAPGTCSTAWGLRGGVSVPLGRCAAFLRVPLRAPAFRGRSPDSPGSLGFPSSQLHVQGYVSLPTEGDPDWMGSTGPWGWGGGRVVSHGSCRAQALTLGLTFRGPADTHLLTPDAAVTGVQCT